MSKVQKKVKLLILSKYSRKGASSRYRMYQYLTAFAESGMEVTVEPLFSDEYLHRLYARESRWLNVIQAYFQRLFFFLKFPQYDIIWLEKEIFPWMPWFIESFFFNVLRAPVVVDYDDAIFHTYDKHRWPWMRFLLSTKCDRVMQHSAVMLAGNDYLAERAKRAGAKQINKVPTVVSAKIFKPIARENSVPVIGWIGSIQTSVYLEKLRPVLQELHKTHHFLFRVVGAQLNWPELPVECVEWNEEQEASLIQSFDIGVMPLTDSPWERGKCGFKLIQYMACGKPVIADPIGVNTEIVISGENGYLISADFAWAAALKKLLDDAKLRQDMGEIGHRRFLAHYSFEAWVDPLTRLFLERGAKSR